MAIASELSGWELFVDGVRFVRDNLRDYMRAAALPVIGTAVCGGIAVEFEQSWIGLLFDLISYAFLSVLGVKWHRFYLLGRKAAPAWTLTFGAREIRFFLYLATCFLVVNGLIQVMGIWVIGPNTALVVGIFVGGIVIVSFVLCRVALILPAVAVDLPGSTFDAIAGSWRCMKGAAFGLFLALFLLGLAAMLVSAVVLGIFGSLPLPGGLLMPVMALLLVLIGVLLEGIGITIVSIAFNRRVPWQGGPPVEEGA